MLTFLPHRCLTARHPCTYAACTASILGTSRPKPGRKALTTRAVRTRLAQRHLAHQTRHVSSASQDAIEQLRKVFLADEENISKNVGKTSRPKKKNAASKESSREAIEQLRDVLLADEQNSTESPSEHNGASKVKSTRDGPSQETIEELKRVLLAHDQDAAKSPTKKMRVKMRMGSAKHNVASRETMERLGKLLMGENLGMTKGAAKEKKGKKGKKEKEEKNGKNEKKKRTKGDITHEQSSEIRHVPSEGHGSLGHPASTPTENPDSSKSEWSTMAVKQAITKLKDPRNDSAKQTLSQFLVSVIQDVDRPIGDRVEAMRTLRENLSLVRKSPSSRGANCISIKEAMVKEPSKKKSSTLRSRGAVRTGRPTPKTDKTSRRLKGRAGFEINSVNAGDLHLVPLEAPQPPVPRLSYGLERVLFNPGVYHLQDPRSHVFNFDPYLAKIMPANEFDFNALKQYITSSRDETLLGHAKAEGRKYVGSTSSMTSALAHFHFLLSKWRPINTGRLSQDFPVPWKSFTALQRGPSSIFLRWKDGVYAIDGDKQYDTANILSMLGKSMEKLLTLPTEDFEKYRRENSDQITEEERNEAEAFHYTTMGDFLLRSQLDAHDPRLPGSGMFDLKTRAVVSIRMDAKEYEQGTGYEIRGRHGEYESYEREYYDMIRSAFLKYSLQVRMGRMDGIFVAFHNTERIFGFQYVSLSEMDYALHGTNDTTTGDLEFKLSLDLLNRVLDKAAAKFPERSLRVHFETRSADTPFMYIFAEPLEEAEIQSIQDSNKAAILEFERGILGIDAKTDEELLEERKAAEWQALRTKVEESMEKDEVNIEEARQLAEVMVEESDSIIGQLSAEEKEKFMDEVMAGFEERIGRGTESGAADEGLDSEEEIAEDDQENGATATSDTEDDEDEDDRGNEDDALDDEDEEQEDDDSEDVEEEDENEDDYDDEEQGDEEREEEEEAEDIVVEQNEGVADSGAENTSDSMNQPNKAEPLETLLDYRAGANTQVEPDLVEDKELLPEEEKPLPDESEESAQPADELTMSESFEATQADKGTTPPEGEVLAMTLTIRNKINGQYTERATDLKPQDKWTVEYALAEIQPGRAQTLYEATKRRRHHIFSSDKKDDPWRYNSGYIGTLQALSKKGRAWRNKIEKDAGPPKVLNSAYEAMKPEGADETER